MPRSTAPPEPVPEAAWALHNGHDRTLFSRFENKYIVPAGQVEPMRRFLAPFVRPDDYARQRPGFAYPICSLYLDTPDLALYNSTVRGVKNRFKLRIRSYGDDPLMPVYAEIKRRVNGVILKRRGRLDRERVAPLLEGRLPGGDWAYPGSGPALEEFRSLVTTCGAGPFLRVRYRREAYIARAGDPVRVTFDTELSGAVTQDVDLSHGPGNWATVPLRGVIVEIKFTDFFPCWIGDLVRTFQLQKQSVPKYILCVRRTSALGALPVASRVHVHAERE